MSKLDPKFNLKRPTTDKDSEVLFRVNYGDGKTFTYPLKSKALDKVLRIPPTLWDSKKQQPIPITKVPQKYVSYKAALAELASMINKIKAHHSDVMNTARLQERKIDKAYLKESYDIYFGLKKKSKLLVSDYTITIIKYLEDGTILTKKSTRYKDDSIKPYRTFKRNLLMFDYLNEIETRFEDIDQDWYSKFVNFLYDEAECPELEMEKEDYTPSSVGKNIKCLTHVMSEAVNRNVCKNMEFKKKYFKAPNQDSFHIALDIDEIKALYSLKLDGEEKTCRDIFLIGCYSGLRQSDFSKIKSSNFTIEKGQGKNGEDIVILSITTKKTTDPVSIPVVTDFLQLVKSYEFRLPSISSIKLNKAIKIIAEKAGIVEDISFISYKGGIAKEVTTQKCKLIASHTGRRSALTNLYLHTVLKKNK